MCFVPEKFIAIPKTSSERRKYIPIDFLDKNFVCLDSLLMIPDAEIWHFRILTSKVHMIWTKTVCGRLESRIRYSAKIVYNNFVWVKMEFVDYAKLILAAEKNISLKNIRKTKNLFGKLSAAKNLFKIKKDFVCGWLMQRPMKLKKINLFMSVSKKFVNLD